MKLISLSPKPRDMVGVYQEPGRPQLQFTQKRSLSMDPDGLLFYEGLSTGWRPPPPTPRERRRLRLKRREQTGKTAGIEAEPM
jgi:hypothetical protein